MWIDTHCHLDAREFDADRAQVIERARQAQVSQIVMPAVRAADFARVRELAHEHGLIYALGIHPLHAPSAAREELLALEHALQAWRDDARLVAVGEIGLDFWVPGLDRAVQVEFYERQLRLARRFALPVLLHVRRSADALLAGLRRLPVCAGIAHAFNGSLQQAEQFLALGFKLGFGGAVTFERASQLRRLAAQLPLSAIVLETDAPDMPPHWLYRTAEQRAQGLPQGRNEPAQLAGIAQAIAGLRGISPEALARASWNNAAQVLTRGLLPLDSEGGCP